jgi:hypothetical protein
MTMKATIGKSGDRWPPRKKFKSWGDGVALGARVLITGSFSIFCGAACSFDGMIGAGLN